MTDPFAHLTPRLEQLPPEERAAFILWAKQVMTRRRLLTTHTHPAQLAASIDPDYRITPAIDLISHELEAATTRRRGRLLITVGPQEGKSSLVAVWTVLRTLQRNPDTRIILASYSQNLAEEASRTARNLIATHGTDAKDPLTGIPMPDKLGLALADDRATMAHWRIKGHKGGLVAVGMGGTITGRAADLLILDDALKGMQAADSPTERRKIIDSYQGDLTTRLAPDAPVVLIQTRWHESDLAGWILEEDRQRDHPLWRHINIPALSEAGLPDALGRPPGVWLDSARGRTVADWEEIRATVGERVFYALYQGSPLPASGGLFSAAWFDLYRLAGVPALYRRVVAVDPAETGKGDEAGVVAAGVDEAGRVILTDDWSGRYTSEEWSRKAVLLALATGATELVFEAYMTATTYDRVLRQAFVQLRREAEVGDGTVEGVPIPVERPFRIVPWKGKGNGVARSAGLRQGVSTGRARVVGYRCATLEHQAVSWFESQHMPDRVAAATVAFEHLAGAGSITLAAPTTAGSWGQMPSGIGQNR